MSHKSFFNISRSCEKQIRLVPHFRDSIYKDLDIGRTLDFFLRRYVRPLARIFNIADCVAIDCACGYGWFIFAYILAGGKSGIAVDIDKERLSAAQDIAAILSVGERIEFINSAIQYIPLSTDEVELFVSIETLEHIGKKNIRPALKRIRDVTSKGVLITTPNRLFPIIPHDFGLPFVHMMHPNERALLRRIFHLRDNVELCDYVSPFDLHILREKFKPVSLCRTFHSFKEYKNHFPVYCPYKSDEKKRFHKRLSFPRASYSRIASALLGVNSYWVMPNLAVIFSAR